MEKNTNISSNSLFHYTNSIDNLISILKEGFRIKYSLEKFGLFDKDENDITDEFAIPIVCFCDIPLNLVQQQISVYGQYAIGLRKQLGAQNAISPVLYLPNYSETRHILNDCARNITKNNRKIREIYKSLKYAEQETMTDVINLYDELIDLTMFVKPYIGYYERKSNGFKDPNYKFYDEREWRYKPSRLFGFKSYLTKEEFLTNDLERNKVLNHISFSKDDISDIIVPKEDVEKVQEELKKIERLKGIDIKIVGTIEKNNYNKWNINKNGIEY